MKFNGSAIFLLFVTGFFLTEGKLLCFRKVKRRGKCAGVIRKGKFASPEACCAKRGSGFALRRHKVGKNRFRCSQCSELKRKTWTKPEMPRIRNPFPTVDPEIAKIKWGPWSPCSVTCGAGWRSRFKVCDDCDKNDYENVQSQPCMVNFYCPVDGNWGPWFPWQPCSLSCDGGSRIRQRKCNYPPPAYGGQNCPGKAENTQKCNEQSCPIDGSWGPWSEFSLCSVTCGQGVMKKKRECNDPAPAFGGRACQSVSVLTKRCSSVPCPQDGGWSLWSSWTQCHVTCGKGRRRRLRSCDSPRPMFGGKDCTGKPIELIECYGGRPCPVDGAWSEWNNYGFCRAERCRKGYQVRTRSCTEPRPVHGGRPCDGSKFDRDECFDPDCPQNGTWCKWSLWSTCSATCMADTALQVRQRECKCPRPARGGTQCDGEGIEVRNCENLEPCKSQEGQHRPPGGRGDVEAEEDHEDGSGSPTGFTVFEDEEPEEPIEEGEDEDEDEDEDEAGVEEG